VVEVRSLSKIGDLKGVSQSSKPCLMLWSVLPKHSDRRGVALISRASFDHPYFDAGCFTSIKPSADKSKCFGLGRQV